MARVDNTIMVPVDGFEPPTPGSEDQCSNPLSYTGVQMLYQFNTLELQYVVMTQTKSIAEAEQVLATYVPQVKELLGKDLTLVRMEPLLAALDNPQNKLRIIHVAGTSGKTSTTYYVAALLKEAGKKVGHTVSPHIDSVTERIQIDLQPLSEAEFCHSLDEFLDLIKDVDPKPTYFELLIAFVYWYFAKAGVDYAVIETGLGGSFDATNVTQGPDKVCVITDIGFDHMHVLGKTVVEIAAQKAGIIHTDNQVFMHKQSLEVMKVFEERCHSQQAMLNVVSNTFENDGELPAYQQRNWHLAKAVYDYVAERDFLPVLSGEHLALTKQIQVPGRMDIRQVADKTLVMDGAHNEQKTEAFASSFQKLFPDKKAAFLLALKEGKEYEAVLPLLKPICSRLIVTTFDTAQDLPATSIDPKILAAEAVKHGFSTIQLETDPKKAYELLMTAEEKFVVITGSFYLLSCLRPIILDAND